MLLQTCQNSANITSKSVPTILLNTAEITEYPFQAFGYIPMQRK